MPRIREAERGKIYDEYIEKESEILTAIVQRVEPKAVYVGAGPHRGRAGAAGHDSRRGAPRRRPHQGLCAGGAPFRVPWDPGGPQVRVSRIHPNLVKRLFEMEVPEIAGGVVTIKSIAREAGSRTKMAVHSSDMMIDPVGACVGQRGSRVDRVVEELKG